MNFEEDYFHTDINFLGEKLDHQWSNSLLLYATVTLKRTLTFDSKISNAYYNLGVNSFDQQNYSKAEKLFKRAVMINPIFIDAHFGLGSCYAKQNDFKKASEAFQQIIHIDPNSFPALNSYGQALFEMGDFYKAAEQFEKVLAKQPKSLDANNNMGLILLIQQRYKEAKICFKTAINHNQDQKSVFEWINWSLALLQQGKKEKAMKTFEEGMALRDKSRNHNHQKQEIIEIYTRTLRMLEKKTVELSDQEEKVGVEKTITGIKFILDLLENFKEEK